MCIRDRVQDGCNQFCSYCIIPYARGRVRSRSREEVVAEVRRLAERGYKEVVLTGIHLSSYGTDIGDDLLSLILSVHQVEGICRIRLGSLEPGIITEEFARTLSECPKDVYKRQGKGCGAYSPGDQPSGRVGLGGSQERAGEVRVCSIFSYLRPRWERGRSWSQDQMSTI